MITISLIILVFTAINVAICQGDNIFQQCKTEEDLAAPNCNLKDLSDEVLIGIIERTGYELTHDVDSYTHGDLVREAAECLEEEDSDYPTYFISGAGESALVMFCDMISCVQNEVHLLSFDCFNKTHVITHLSSSSP